MVVSEISENGEFKGDTHGAEFGKGVGGNFEDEKFGTLIGDGADATIESKSVYSGHVV